MGWVWIEIEVNEAWESAVGGSEGAPDDGKHTPEMQYIHLTNTYTQHYCPDHGKPPNLHPSFDDAPCFQQRGLVFHLRGGGPRLNLFAVALQLLDLLWESKMAGSAFAVREAHEEAENEMSGGSVARQQKRQATASEIQSARCQAERGAIVAATEVAPCRANSRRHRTRRRDEMGARTAARRVGAMRHPHLLQLLLVFRFEHLCVGGLHALVDFIKDSNALVYAFERAVDLRLQLPGARHGSSVITVVRAGTGSEVSPHPG